MGVYVAVKYSDVTVDILHDRFKDVRNLVPKDKMHTTIIYSRTGDYSKIDISKYDVYKLFTSIKKLEIWDTQDGKRALVGVLTDYSGHLMDTHKDIMTNPELTYDYPEYKPHITISYDVGSDYVIDQELAYGLYCFYSRIYKEELIENWQNKDV